MVWQKENKSGLTKTIRRRIRVRDKHRCKRCGKRLRYNEGAIDHIIPRAEGGCTEDWNLQLLCDTCHADKSAREHARGQRRRQARARWQRGTTHPGILTEGKTPPGYPPKGGPDGPR